MAYMPHGYLQVLGDVVEGANEVEQWAFGIRFGDRSGLNNLPSDSQNSAIASALETWWGTYQTWIPNVYRLVGFKWNGIGADGSYERPEQPNTYYYPTPHKATGTGNPLPLQVACAVTLRTRYKGRSFTGRCYLPAAATNRMSGFYWSETHRSDVVNTFTTLLDNLDAIIEPATGGRASIVSKKGTIEPITLVQVGRVPDTQRRRRRSLSEDITVVYR